MTPDDWAKSFTDVMARLTEEFAWATNAPLTGLNCYQTEGGWLMVIKTRSVQRGALVAFYGGADLGACAEQVAYDMHHNPGITWKPDKYLNGK
jgi:hypothetical protein